MDESQPSLNYPPQDLVIAEFRHTFLTVKTALSGYFGITQARLLIFQQLNTGGETSQADLQHCLGVDGSVITRLVKQMEAEGLLTRRSDPADNRYTLVQLTGQGQKQIKQLMVRLLALEPILLQGLSPEEIVCIRRALARVRQNAETLRDRS
jgi:DNA-binding MarR family transcriptional regulator